MYLQKVISRKNKRKNLFFVSILKVYDENSRIRIRNTARFRLPECYFGGRLGVGNQCFGSGSETDRIGIQGLPIRIQDRNPTFFTYKSLVNFGNLYFIVYVKVVLFIINYFHKYLIRNVVYKMLQKS